MTADVAITVQDRRRHGFFIIDNIIIDEYARKIGASAYLVYSGLSRMTNREGICFPSLNRLCKLLGMTKPTLTKAINTLIEHGLIAKQHRFNDKGEHISNLYILLDVTRGTEGSKKDLPPPSKMIFPPSERGSKNTLPKQETLSNKTQQTEQNPQVPSESVVISETQKAVVVALIDLGMSENVAEFLARKYSQERIAEKIAYLEFLQGEQPYSIKSPCGWLRTAIEKDFGKPDGFTPDNEQNASEDAESETEENLSALTAQEIQEQKKQEQQRRRDELTEQYGTQEEDFSFWEKAKLEIAYGTQPYIGDLVAQAEILSVQDDRVVIGVTEQDHWRQFQHPRIQEAIERTLHSIVGRTVELEATLCV